MPPRGFIQLTVATYPRECWINKTPTAEMVRAAPLELWPQTCLIVLKRRVIEIIQSRHRRFPHDTLKNYNRNCVDAIQGWISVRDSLGDAVIDVEQLDMAMDGDEVTERSITFLDLPDSAAEQSRHAFASDYLEPTRWVGVVESLDDLNLSEDDRHELRAACDLVMAAFGYSYDDMYFLDVRLRTNPHVEGI